MRWLRAGRRIRPADCAAKYSFQYAAKRCWLKVRRSRPCGPAPAHIDPRGRARRGMVRLVQSCRRTRCNGKEQTRIRHFFMALQAARQSPRYRNCVRIAFAEPRLARRACRFRSMRCVKSGGRNHYFSLSRTASIGNLRPAATVVKRWLGLWQVEAVLLHARYSEVVHRLVTGIRSCEGTGQFSSGLAARGRQSLPRRGPGSQDTIPLRVRRRREELAHQRPSRCPATVISMQFRSDRMPGSE
jgi:hypothetical protein